jgi:hypothetical protein
LTKVPETSWKFRLSHRKIKCTGNHLIRTDQGWVAARDIKTGSRILSPAPAVAAPSSTELAPTDDLAVSFEGTSFRATTTAKSPTAWSLSLSKLSPCGQFANAGAARNWAIPAFLQQKGKGLKSIQSYWERHPYQKGHGVWDLRTEHLNAQLEPLSAEVLGLLYGTLLGDGSISLPQQAQQISLAWPGHTENSNGHGWNTKHQGWLACGQRSTQPATLDTVERSTCCRTTYATPTLSPSSTASKVGVVEKLSHSAGFLRSLPKDWPGGTLDDGSLSLSPEGSPQIQFHTEGYSSGENHLIAEWLTSLGYSAKVRTYTRSRSGRQYDYVAMGAKAARNLLADLQRFSIPAMDYKFGDGRICDPRWG